jgi:hypothetical protein
MRAPTNGLTAGAIRRASEQKGTAVRVGVRIFDHHESDRDDVVTIVPGLDGASRKAAS